MHALVSRMLVSWLSEVNEKEASNDREYTKISQSKKHEGNDGIRLREYYSDVDQCADQNTSMVFFQYHVQVRLETALRYKVDDLILNKHLHETESSDSVSYFP